MRAVILITVLFIPFIACKKDKKIILNNKAAKIIGNPEKYNKIDSAIIYLDKAIKRDSNYFTAWSNMQEAYEIKFFYFSDSSEKQEVLKNMILIYDKLIDFVDDEPLMIIKQATWFDKLGWVDSAYTNYQTALRLIDNRLDKNTEKEVDYFLKVYLLCEMEKTKLAQNFYHEHKTKLRNSMSFLESMEEKEIDSLKCDKVLEHAPS